MRAKELLVKLKQQILSQLSSCVRAILPARVECTSLTITFKIGLNKSLFLLGGINTAQNLYIYSLVINWTFMCWEKRLT